MQIRLYLKKELETKARKLEDQLSKTKDGLKTLQKIDLSGADYEVYLTSLWEEYGEKPTVLNHKGTLEEAIKKAESIFKKTNSRNDVQAQYLVVIRLNGLAYAIPRKYWEEFAEKH